MAQKHEEQPNGHVNFGGVRFEKEKAAAWIFRLLLLCGFLWIQNNFVSRDEYQKDVAAVAVEGKERTDLLNKINTRLEVMDERLKGDNTHKRVEKLEEWFHALDKRIPDKH